MIDLVARDVGAGLKRRKYPLEVRYEKPRQDYTTCARSHVDMMRDRDVGDIIGKPVGAARNPRATASKMLGGLAMIYARSSKPGANVWNHQHTCDYFVNAIVVELGEWSRINNRADTTRITEARYIDAQEDPEIESWAGVCYRIRFSIHSNVVKLDYDGGTMSEGVIDAVANVTRVKVPESADEIGCGVE